MADLQENVRRNLVLYMILLTTVARSGRGVRGDYEGLNPNSVHPCLERDPLMDPTHEILHGREVVWQIPANPKAVLYLAHGSGNDALSYFDPGPNCEACYGLPEDRTVVLDALKRSYAVIVVKSLGIHFEIEDDLVPITDVLMTWIDGHFLKSLPFVVWGHSNGGWFATYLTLTMPHISAFVFTCSEGYSELIESASQFPPVFFTYMPRDISSLNVSAKVREVMAILTERGVVVEKHECSPKQLSPSYFTERILCLSNEISEKIYSAYKAEGWLNADDYLIKNPREEDWEAPLWKSKALPFCPALGRLCLDSHVEQEINVAYAEHIITSEANEEIYTWLDSILLSEVQPSDPLAAGFFFSR